MQKLCSQLRNTQIHKEDKFVQKKRKEGQKKKFAKENLFGNKEKVRQKKMILNE